MIRALIVDDERMARKRLRTLLAREADVAVVGECASGGAAVEAIRQLEPELVFLDVQMPEMNGLAVVRALGTGRLPIIVFVTAFDQYALQAFEVSALDYLTKPFDGDRFQATLGRVRRQLHLMRGAEGTADVELRRRLASLLSRFNAPAQTADRLMVKGGGRIIFLRADEVDWIEAAGNYARLHAGRETHLLHETLSSLVERLDPTRFARIHRSTVVNLDRIREIQPWFHGDAVAVLRDGTKLNVSRTYRQRLERS